MRGLYPTPEWQINDGYKIDKALLFAVIRRESAFNFKAKSSKGARGLMQIMPRTASKINNDYRSRMNVPFRIRDDELTMKFVEEAESAGLYQLKGHRLVGGLRASIYNAMPIEGIEELLNFMNDFEKNNK